MKTFRQQQAISKFILDKSTAWHVMIVQFCVVALMFEQLTLWMIAIILLSLLWQCAVNLQVLRTPNKYLVMVIGIFGASAIAMSGRELGLLLAMIHLLSFSFAIKALEINYRRDLYLIMLLAIFLLSCSFIFKQTVWFSLLVLAVLIVNLSLIYRFHAPAIQVTQSIKHCVAALVISIPLAATMFVVFPRLQPFWQMPLADAKKTGLSSEVRPGDIANLIQSSDLAFRVNFSGAVPTQQQMYWRAMSLPVFDGKSWQRFKTKGDEINWPLLKRQSNLRAEPIKSGSNTFQYQVFAEPSFQHWLFALDIAQTNERSVFQLYDYSLVTEKPISKTFAYQVVSFTDAAMNMQLSERDKQRYLKLGQHNNDKLVNYAEQLNSRFQQPERVIDAVLAEFANNSFYYTLQPPRLINNNLDQFFFDTRAGFCEHYASAFAFIMRAAGIPSRLVTGYLGGEYNPQGDYFSIYQYDAHAWTEVWLEGKGWVRVDPTASVSPERILNGMTGSFSADELHQNSGLFALSGWGQTALYQFVRLQLEAIDYQWTKLVVGYSMEKQSQLLKSLFGNQKHLKAAASFIAVLLVVISAFWLWQRRFMFNNRKEPWQRELDNLCVALSKQYFARKPEQTINQYFKLLADEDNRLCDLLTIAKQFDEISFNPSLKNREQMLIIFTKQVRHLTKHCKSLHS